MSYLSLTNLFTKSHNPFLSEAQSTNLLLLTDKNVSTTTTHQQLNENNNNNQITTGSNNKNNNDKTIQEVWSKHNFKEIHKKITSNNSFNNDAKMSWTSNSNNNNNNNNNNNDIVVDQLLSSESNGNNKDNKIEDMDITTSPSKQEEKEDNNRTSPSHHARRPMNAFLIFCKKHRPIVRDKFPALENRGVTRILGEWWALLDDTEKSPYTNLAKEHKDAFLLANPDFKWYKLPAPPLRSLVTRPVVVGLHKVPSPICSPNTISSLMIESEFTPGKLADESQLGGLTSLMNNNFTTKPSLPLSPTATTTIGASAKLLEQQKQGDDDFNKAIENNNNVDDDDDNKTSRSSCYNSLIISPVNLIKPLSLPPPPKPIKKRSFPPYNHENNNNSSVARRNLLLNDDDNNISTKTDVIINNNNINHKTNVDVDDNNITNQDLMNKVVDSIYSMKNNNENSVDVDYSSSSSSKEIRKSGRQCKGKRYEQFMVECKLLGNKRDTKLTSQKFATQNDFDKIENELLLNYNDNGNNKFIIDEPNHKPSDIITTNITETPKLDLDYTIKRLAERTNIKICYENQKDIIVDTISNNNNNNDVKSNNERVDNNIINNNINISDNTENNNNNNNNNNTNNKNSSQNFNLDLRINNLPSLCYEIFSQRKKDSKKRKNRKIDNDHINNKGNNKKFKYCLNEVQLVGSKKRKNKHSITHLEKKLNDNDNNTGSSPSNDYLCALETLAEVAANKQKISEPKIAE